MEDKMKWKTLKSEYLIQRPGLTARRDTVELPNGVINDEYYVLEYPTWINVIALTTDGNMVMIRQYRHGIDQTCFEIVAGVCEKGEDPEAAARRELLEETGYTVTPIRLSGIYERISEGREDGANHKIYFIFLCKLEDVPCRAPTQRDRFQIGREWIDVHSVRTSNLFPRAIRDNIGGLIGYGETIFIGSEKE